MDLITQRFLMAAAGASAAGGGGGAVSTTDVPNTIASTWQVGNGSFIHSPTAASNPYFPQHRNLVYASTLGKYFYLFPNGIVGQSTDGITWAYNTMDGFLEPNIPDSLQVYSTQGATNRSCNLIWTGTKLVGTLGAMIISSVDGATWNLEAYPTKDIVGGLTSYTIHDLYFNGTYYYITVGNTATYANPNWIFYSTDLATWNKQLLATDSNTYGTSIPLYSFDNSSNVIIARSGTYVSYTTNNFSSNTYTQVWSSAMNKAISVTKGSVNGNNVIVFVGQSGTIYRSNSNGNITAWSTATSPTANTLHGVTYGNNMFIAVGVNGTIISSPNTDTWSIRTSNTKHDIHNVSWTGSKFIAISRFLENLSSTDGITWTNSGSPIQKSTMMQLNASTTEQDIRNIAYSPTLNLYLAAGPGLGNTAFESTQVTAQRLATSTDGLTWSNIANPANITTTIGSVNWTGNEFVIGAGGGKVYTTSNTVTWKTATLSDTSVTIYAAAGNGSKIIAFSNSTTVNSYGDYHYALKNKGQYVEFIVTAWVSTDSGTSWTATPIRLPTQPFEQYDTANFTIKRFEYNTELSKFIVTYAPSSSENKAITATSIDGINWLMEPIGTMVDDIVYFSNNYFVLDAGSIYKSSDLINFTTSLRPDRTNVSFIGIANTANVLAAATSNNGVYVTTDGTTWSKPYIPLTPAPRGLGISSMDGNIIFGHTLGNLVSSNGTDWWMLPQYVTRSAPISYGGQTYHIALCRTPTWSYSVGKLGDLNSVLLYSTESNPEKWYPLLSFADAAGQENVTDFCVESTGNNQIITVGKANSTDIMVKSITFNGNANSSTVTTHTFVPPAYTAQQQVYNPHIYRNKAGGKYYINYSINYDTYPADYVQLTGYLSSSSWNGSYSQTATQLTWYGHSEIYSPDKSSNFIMTRRGYSLDDGVTWHLYPFKHPFAFIGRNTTGLYAVTKTIYSTDSTNDARMALWKQETGSNGEYWQSFGDLNVYGLSSVSDFATGSSSGYPTFCVLYNDGSVRSSGQVTSGMPTFSSALSGINFVKWIQSKGLYIAGSGTYPGRYYYSSTGAQGSWSYIDVTAAVSASVAFSDAVYIPQGDRYILVSASVDNAKTMWVSSTGTLSTTSWTKVSLLDPAHITAMAVHNNNGTNYFYAALSTGKIYQSNDINNNWSEISNYYALTPTCLVSDGLYMSYLGNVNSYIFGFADGRVVYNIGGATGQDMIGSGYPIVSVGLMYDNQNYAVIGWVVNNQGEVYKYSYSGQGGNSYSWSQYKTFSLGSGNTITSIKTGTQRHSTNTTIALCGDNYLMYTPGPNVANLTIARAQV